MDVSCQFVEEVCSSKEVDAIVKPRYEKAGVKNVSLLDQSTRSKDQLAALDRGTPFGVSLVERTIRDWVSRR
jgi:hypothetical protein